MKIRGPVALVNPPSPFLLEERVFPNLGLVQLATSLKQRNFNVEIFDLCGKNLSDSEIKGMVKDFEYIGFSSTTPQFTETARLNRLIKGFFPNKFTFIGGAHPSAVYSLEQSNFPEDPNAQSLKYFDSVVIGEGETVDFTDFPRGKIVTPNIEDLDSLPIADRSLIDIDSYRYTLKGRKTTTIMTQRGCPFKCSFCCGRNIEMYKKVRSFSPERILKELDYLNENFGYDSFMWFDDELNINPKRIYSISKLITKRKYIHRGFVRSDLLLKHPETLDQLAEAGFVELCSGVESGSARILSLIGKGTTPEINAAAAKKIMEKGFRYKAFVMVGSPSETLEDIEHTSQWIRNVKPDGLDVTILNPYPGSLIYNSSVPSKKFSGFDRESSGLFFRVIDYSRENSFYKGVPGKYHCNVRTEQLSSEDLLECRDRLEREFSELKNQKNDVPPRLKS